METSSVRGVRLAAQKGRLVADLIRGKPVGQGAHIPGFHGRRRRRHHQDRRWSRPSPTPEHNGRRGHRRTARDQHPGREGRHAEPLPPRVAEGPRWPGIGKQTCHIFVRSATPNQEIGEKWVKINPHRFRLAVTRNWGSALVRGTGPGLCQRCCGGPRGPRVPAQEAAQRLGRAAS